MKQRIILRSLFGFLVLLLVLIIYWQLRKPRPLNMPINRNELVNSDSIEVPRIVKAHDEAQRPNSKKKKWELPLGYYPRRKIPLKSSHLWLLHGLTATAKKHFGIKEVARLNHYFLYKTSDGNLENIVYDDEKRQYGVLTNELIVIVQKDELRDIAQSYGLEILKEGAEGSESILRTNSTTFFLNEIAQFSKEARLKYLRPYVSYGLAKFR